mgnify:CR=1 FL=1
MWFLMLPLLTEGEKQEILALVVIKQSQDENYRHQLSKSLQDLTAKLWQRCEDPSLLTEILADKRIDVALRQIAPTVLVSDFDLDEVLNVIRANGYLPAAESAQGILLSSPHNKRVQNRPKPPRIVGELEVPTDEAITSAIRAIKVGEKSTAKQSELRNSGQVPRTTANETLDILNKLVLLHNIVAGMLYYHHFVMGFL